VAQDAPQDLRRLCAERHPHSDLLGALCDRVRRDRAQADRGEASAISAKMANIDPNTRNGHRCCASY
jgi:hypothetical protein